MFSLYFTIKNPFKVASVEQTDYIEYDRKITTNKSVEVQFSKWPAHTMFNIGLDTVWFGQDHGGIGINIELLGYYFSAKIYDIRHWDYENHCWEEYDNDD
jgi:hypothetical protein